MRIESVQPPQPPRPPREIEMRFTQDEGWAVLGALNEWIANHKEAIHREQWIEWAMVLNDELRS